MNNNPRLIMAPAGWFPSLLLLMSPVVLPAERALEPHVAEYKVKISVLSGTLTSEMYTTESGFAARSIIRPTGFASLLMNGTIEEYSEFSLTGDGIRPQHYESTDTLSSDHKRMTFDFDYSEQAVSGQINDENFRFEFDGPVHDRVSIQYQLMHNLLNQNGGGDYALLDGDELKELTVTNIGSRKVRVLFGTFEAVGIQHRAAESSRVSTLWCVAELNYLPVIIEQHRDGKLRVRAVLETYRPLQPQAAEQQAGVSRPGSRVAIPASGRP